MKDQDLIDNYLQGKLSPDEERSVEQKAREDPDFREELAFHRQVKSAFARDTHRRLKSRLQSLPAGPAKTRRLYAYWPAAAAVLVVLGLTLYLFTARTKPLELYLARFEPYPNVVLPVTRDSSVADSRAHAYAAYEAGDFRLAYEMFGSIADPEGLFYRGVSALALDRPRDALALLARYQGLKDARLVRQAQWYRGLAHLRQEELQEARELFAALAEHPGYKQKEASELLKRL